METIENIIHALRCSNTPFSEGDERKCEEWVYATTEFVEGHKWVSCDCERIGLDAAEALEKLTVFQEPEQAEKFRKAMAALLGSVGNLLNA